MTNDMTAQKVLPRLSAELGIPGGQIAAVAKLLGEGNTDDGGHEDCLRQRRKKDERMIWGKVPYEELILTALECILALVEGKADE